MQSVVVQCSIVDVLEDVDFASFRPGRGGVAAEEPEGGPGATDGSRHVGYVCEDQGTVNGLEAR